MQLFGCIAIMNVSGERGSGRERRLDRPVVKLLSKMLVNIWKEVVIRRVSPRLS